MDSGPKSVAQRARELALVLAVAAVGALPGVALGRLIVPLSLGMFWLAAIGVLLGALALLWAFARFDRPMRKPRPVLAITCFLVGDFGLCWFVCIVACRALS